MKTLLLLLGIVTSGAMIYTVENETRNKLNVSSSEYHWQKVVDEGRGQFPEKWEEGNWPMGIEPVFACENKLWMIGQKQSWSSENGIDWSAYPKADWNERHGMSFVYFKNKLWMFGGMKHWGDFRNDIWSSADGKNWQRVTEHAAWPERVRHKTVVFKNKLWLIGGTISSGKPDQLPGHSYNDIWSSEDGSTWKLEIENAPWPARHDPKVAVFKDKLWMMAGVDQVGGNGQQDVWNSSDGKNWTLITRTAPWEGRRNNGLVVFDNLLWIFGGVNKNDVWSSADGLNWKQVYKHAPWSTRTTETSVTFRNKLWIYSGKTGREDSWSGDVWTLSR